MRRIATVLLTLAVVVPSAGAATRSSLRAVDLDPLTVRGSNFRAGERVTLLLTADGVVRKQRVRAGSRGGFTVRFTYRVGRCSEFVVQAFGWRGSRAMVEQLTAGCFEEPAP